MRKFWLFFMILVFLSAVYAIAEEKTVLTYDEIIKLYRISDPQLSPDGKWIVFTATKYSFETDRGNSDLWLISSRGGNAKQITFSNKSDRSPRWAPDGKKIAFLSSRSGKPQVYIMPVEIGEPNKLTDIPTGVTSMKWTPSGEYLLFSSEVYKGCEEMKCNEEKAKAEKNKKVSAKIADHLLYRHWDSWKIGKVSRLFSYKLSDGKITSLTPANRWMPFGPFQGDEQYVVSPDSKMIAYSRRSSETPAVDTNDDIFLLPIEGGEEKHLTLDKGSDTTPLFSPDGKYITYLRMRRGGFEADKKEIILIELENGKKTSITAGYDGSVNEYVWAPDGATIYLTSESQGRVGLYRVDIEEKNVERIYQSGVCGSLNISPEGDFLIYTYNSTKSPNEIYRFDLEDSNPVQLTKLNQDVLSGVEMNPVEDFNFRGAGGDMVHGFMVKPPFFDESKKYPMIYVIHGGPQGAIRDGFHFRWNLQMFAARDYVVTAVNFHGSTGYGQKFVDSITGDWGGKPYRDLMTGVDYLVNKYKFIDRNRIGAAGASYGGYMIDWIAGHTERFKCLVSHAGVYNLASMYGSTEELWFPEWEFHGAPWDNPSHYRKFSPSTYAKRFKTPTLVIHGQFDFRVPVTQGMEFFTALQRMGVESKFIYFPDETHFVAKPNNARFWYNEVLDWMDKYLKK